MTTSSAPVTAGSRRPAPDVDVLVVGAGITGIYQLYRAREAGFSVQLVEAGGGVGGTWYWNRYPGARFDSESYTLRLPVLAGAVRRLGVAGALRGPARDRALPQPRGRPVRPPPPHALRRPGHRRCLRRAVGHVERDARRRHRSCERGSWSRPPACCRCRTPPTCPGATTSGARRTTPGWWPATPVDFAGKRVAVVGTSSSGVQVVPTILDEVESLTVYQRTANWCTPLNNTPITPEEQAQLRADFEDLCEVLNTSISGFAHPVNAAQRVRGLRGRAAGLLREDVGQPRLHEADEQLRGPAVQRGGQRRVVRVHRREDPRHRRGPRDRRAADPQGPSVRREATPVRHRLLRGVQRPEGVAGRPAGDADRAADRDGHRDDRRRARVRHRRVGDRLRLRHRRAVPHGHPGPGRPGAHGRTGPTARRTFLGLQTRGFPNLFFPGGPHAAAGNNPRYNGDQVDFVTDVLVHARAARLRRRSR